MAVLIGDSGHGRDIHATLEGSWDWIAHHDGYDYVDHGETVLIGINDPQIRATVANELCVQDLEWVHPHAYIGPECTFGHGTHINYGAMMTRTTVGTHTTICPGVHLGGDITIGDRVFIGMGAIIGVKHPGEHITVGDDAVIGAGALVLASVAAGQKVLGVWT